MAGKTGAGRGAHDPSGHDMIEGMPAQPPTTPLGVLVDEAINRLGLTVAAAARRCGIPTSTLDAYRHGRITGERASDDKLRKIANGLGIPYDDVVEAAGAVNRDSDRNTMLRLFDRLPNAQERELAVELLRVQARIARERHRNR